MKTHEENQSYEENQGLFETLRSANTDPMREKAVRRLIALYQPVFSGNKLVWTESHERRHKVSVATFLTIANDMLRDGFVEQVDETMDGPEQCHRLWATVWLEPLEKRLELAREHGLAGTLVSEVPESAMSDAREVAELKEESDRYFTLYKESRDENLGLRREIERLEEDKRRLTVDLDAAKDRESDLRDTLDRWIAQAGKTGGRVKKHTPSVDIGAMWEG